MNQQLFEHSELLINESVPVNFNDDQIKSFYRKGGIQICAKNSPEKKCTL
ncbi:ATP-binding protein [Listeria seeligeri FSL N1-067]|uniref:ATP-binding protein n=1 Tax=Listeria seeligeri FSL N1-067 TaxID=702453 RepID=E3ZQ77_LISSE|nr:ATP-binding protein [Listeria seeligeri FSL N1-067]